MLSRYGRVGDNNIVPRSLSDADFRPRNLTVENISRGKDYSERSSSFRGLVRHGFGIGCGTEVLSVGLDVRYVRPFRSPAGQQESTAITADRQLGIGNRRFALRAFGEHKSFGFSTGHARAPPRPEVSNTS